jgi:hypothetical protein
MTEKELDQKIDKAPIEKVRQCLKIIASLWFVEEGDDDKGYASFDKPITGDIVEAVTGELHRFGFCPPEISCQSCKKLGETTCGNDTKQFSCHERK